MSKSLPPRVALSLTILMWGCSFIASKIALREISPVTLLFTRFALGTAFLFAILLWRKVNPLPPRSALPALTLMGFIGIFVHHMLQGYGLTMTTALHTGWLIGIVPIWSAVLSALFLKEKFGKFKIIGLIGGFAGAILVISRGELSTQSLQLPSTSGDFLILLSTLNWAVYSIIGHRTIKSLGATRATTGMMFLGWLMLIPFFLFERGWRELPNLTASGWSSIIFLGVGCSGVGYLTWYSALEQLEVSRVAAFLYVQPLITLVAAVIFLQEKVTAPAIIGGLVVLLSVFVIQRAPNA